MGKFTLITTLFILLLSNFSYGAGYDFNPETQANYQYQSPKIEGDISNFADEKVIVLYRGIHFLSDKFTKKQREQYITNSQVNKPMFSSAAYELAKQNYGDNVNNTLSDYGYEVAAYVNELEDYGPCIIGGSRYSSARYAFQEIYSNNCAGFYKQLKSPGGDYKKIFNQFDFNSNPLISFSDHVKHPAKYGFGLKNYGTDHILPPKYNLQGRPKHPILGKLYGIILDEAAVEELKPLNAWEAHHSGEIKLHSHFRNNVLSEREISISGFVPEDYVVFEMPLSVPSFTGKYPAYYEKKYGLTKQRYNNLRKIFTNHSIIQEEKNKKTTQMMNNVIEAEYQGNNLIYENCLSYMIPSLFEKRLNKIGAKISKLTLSYELE